MTGAPHENGLDVIEKEYKAALARIEELEAALDKAQDLIVAAYSVVKAARRLGEGGHR